MWCQKCFTSLPLIVHEECGIPTLYKKDLLKRKFDEEVAEPWAQCDGCGRWVHQICALFNDRHNATETEEAKKTASVSALRYYCPLCKLEAGAGIGRAVEMLLDNIYCSSKSRAGEGAAEDGSTEEGAVGVEVAAATSASDDADPVVRKRKGRKTTPSPSANKLSKTTMWSTLPGDNTAVATTPKGKEDGLVLRISIGHTGSSTAESLLATNRNGAGSNLVECKQERTAGCFPQEGLPLSPTIASLRSRNGSSSSLLSGLGGGGGKTAQPSGLILRLPKTKVLTPSSASVIDRKRTRSIDSQLLRGSFTEPIENGHTELRAADDNGLIHTLALPKETAAVDRRRKLRFDIPEAANGDTHAVTTVSSDASQTATVKCADEIQCLLPTVEPLTDEERRTVKEGNMRWRASSLPRTELSDFLEALVEDRLINLGFADAARTFTIRLASNSDHYMEVPEPILANLTTDGGGRVPKYMPYRQKCILLFQSIEGVDVCLFCLYVQEFDEKCPQPNCSKVYIAYIDSVEYFRPREARTTVYHEVIVGYLKWAQVRGFKQAHIWSCPPQRGDSFIFWCHPSHQRTPSRERLNQWYINMLYRAALLHIIDDVDTLWNEYFGMLSRREEGPVRAAAKSSLVGKGGLQKGVGKSAGGMSSSGSVSSVSDQNVLVQCPPVFEGDFWVIEYIRVHRLVQSRVKSGDDVVVNQRRCRDLLKQIMSKPTAPPFNQPVDPVALNIPSYPDIIKHPMDLGTIRDKLRLNKYNNMLEFVEVNILLDFLYRLSLIYLDFVAGFPAHVQQCKAFQSTWSPDTYDRLVLVGRS